VDFCGPMGVASLGGCYFSLAVTEFNSRFVMHYVLRIIGEALQSFRRFLTIVHALGHKIEHVRLDNHSTLMDANLSLCFTNKACRTTFLPPTRIDTNVEWSDSGGHSYRLQCLCSTPRALIVHF
jgi:hypothetical protein